MTFLSAASRSWTGARKIFAYELLFRSDQTSGALVEDNVQATASVMVTALSNIGIKTLIGEKKGFININEGILRSGIIELLPKENTVFEILETVKITADVINECRRLKKEGYQFALDDFVYDESAVPMFDIVEYVKVDLPQTSPEALEGLRMAFLRYPLKLLGEKVETGDPLHCLRDLGFDLFQGYFFA